MGQTRALCVEAFFRRTGITFNVYGQQEAVERLIPFDIIPRIDEALPQGIFKISYVGQADHSQAPKPWWIMISKGCLVSSKGEQKFQAVKYLK